MATEYKCVRCKTAVTPEDLAYCDSCRAEVHKLADDYIALTACRCGGESCQVHVIEAGGERLQICPRCEGFLPTFRMNLMRHGDVRVTDLKRIEDNRATFKDIVGKWPGDETDEEIAEYFTRTQASEDEREFLQRLLVEFEANRCECGEPWKDTDAHDLVRNRIAELEKSK